MFEQLNNFKIDIVFLAETKKKGTGNGLQRNYLHLYNRLEKGKRASAGVSIVVHKKWTHCIKNWDEINQRIIKMEIEICSHVVVILAVCAPTDDALSSIKDEFI